MPVAHDPQLAPREPHEGSVVLVVAVVIVVERVVATADGERQPVALAAVLAVREAFTDDPDDAARLTGTPIDRSG